MPNATFFRLPQEKQERLLQAAQEEFTRVNFAEASINRIVKEAKIPRGSFYQYFADKDDLFYFMLESMRESYVSKLYTALEQVEGDMFRLPLLMFDLLIEPTGEPVSELVPGVRILKLNQSLDVQSFLGGKNETVLSEILKKVDTSQLCSKDAQFVMNVFHLLIFSLVNALTETLWDHRQREAQRLRLQDMIGIIRNGSLSTAAVKEETI